jgi:D-alanyl-D-alanine carboxypeptidase (penicillin-binding protein 5/6)
MDMKTRRFLSAFLALAILVCMFTATAASADESVTDPNIQAQAALLIDRDSGTVLYDKNIHEHLYPASLTKIMTCLLVLENVASGKLSLDQEITAPAAAFEDLDPDGSTANIKEGEVLTLEQLLYCMMVVSANEAANILAVTVSGSTSDFVDLMNKEAAKLGCDDTHFSNPIGLQDTEHYTSAWDLYLITQAALQYDEFMKICDTADIVIPATNLHDQRHLYSTNYLLSSFRATGYIDKRAHGIKTGSTSDAGHCLVSTASKNGLHFLSVVLGCKAVALSTGRTQVQSFSETSRLFDWGFQNFSYQTVLKSTDILGSMPVTLSKKAGEVALHVKEDIRILVPNGITPDDLTHTLRFTKKTTQAPVTKGDKLGEIKLSYGDTAYATVPLVAYSSIPASRSLVLMNQVKQFFQRTIVRVLCVIVLVLLAVLLVWKLTVGRRRYRSGKVVKNRRNYRGRRKHL